MIVLRSKTNMDITLTLSIIGIRRLDKNATSLRNCYVTTDDSIYVSLILCSY